MMKFKTFTALAALSLLAGCNTVLNGPDQALSIDEQHPITVESQTVTLTIDADRTLTDISAVDKARLKAFAAHYFRRGEGPITITAPVGGQADFYGQEMAADIRNELHRSGIAWEQMLGATYRAAGDSEVPSVLISFTNYVASSSPCADWSEELERRFRNSRSKNFGCAQQQNLAAMIANPKDLIEPAALTPGDAGRNDVVIERYRAGEPTSAAEDEAVVISSAG